VLASLVTLAALAAAQRDTPPPDARVQPAAATIPSALAEDPETVVVLRPGQVPEVVALSEGRGEAVLSAEGELVRPLAVRPADVRE
jgi:hypothetical protein